MTPEEALEPFSIVDPYPFEDFGDALPGQRTRQKLTLVRAILAACQLSRSHVSHNGERIVTRQRRRAPASDGRVERGERGESERQERGSTLWEGGACSAHVAPSRQSHRPSPRRVHGLLYIFSRP